MANTEAFNEERFEGPGVFAGHSVRGRFNHNRITVIDPATGGVAPRHLNKHIDYGTCCAPVPNAESQKSLALPQGMAISSDGQTLYVAALGSDKIGVLSTAALEADTFVPDLADQIPVSGGGPTGVALDEARGQLYALTRYDNSIAIIDVESRAEIAHVPMYSPEPESVVRGRRFLYDASFSSSHGDSACASCHVFGDVDSLAWDLGDHDFQGDQIRGFGFGHDGTMDTIFRFHDQLGFNEAPGVAGFPPGAAGDVLRRQVTDYLHAFDTNLAPIVGQQVTIAGACDAATEQRVDLLMARAGAGECDLVVKGRMHKEEVGFLYQVNGTFRRDRAGSAPISAAALRQVAAAGNALTYTCAPPGAGGRMAIDRDGDGSLDGDEEDAGTDPADPASKPGG